MTRYAILSDIHANVEALEAVLAHAHKQGAEAIWFLGDLVVYGPSPGASIRRLVEAMGDWPGTSIIGNNDKAVLDKKPPEDVTEQLVGAGQLSAAATRYRRATVECHSWTVSELDKDPDSLALLKQLAEGPRHVLLNSVLVHASPCDPVGMNGNYITTSMEAEEALFCMDEAKPICFFGHTHRTTIFREIRRDRPYQNCEILRWEQLTKPVPLPDNGSRVLINPGSVGQPRDNDQRAAYLILDDEKWTVEFYRVDYEMQKTMTRLADTGMSSDVVAALQDRLRTAK